MANPFIGYSGYIWQTAYTALSYYLQQIDTAIAASNPALVMNLSTNMSQTLTNAADAISANDYLTAWTAENNSLLAVEALPLQGVDPVSALYFSSRAAAFGSAAQAISGIIPQGPFLPPSVILPQGSPVIPYVGLLEFFKNFSYETPPAGLSSANFVADVAACASAFTIVANAVQVFQGLYPNQLLNIVQQQANIANVVSTIISDMTSGPIASNLSPSVPWNGIVSVPSVCMTAQLYNSAPFLPQNQQSAVIRYALLYLANQINFLTTSLHQKTTTVPSTAILYNNETLMSFANRVLGNFELWTEIATLNNLVPPWVGPTSSKGIAGWGTKLLLPTPGIAKDPMGASPSYNFNVLKTDFYFGPINGDMPTWTGDYQTITGVNNLSISLGRRLQTLLTSLIYHPDYGCRIPNEVGTVQDSSTGGHIAAFGEAALQTDPRVQAILSSQIQVNPDGSILYTGSVAPIGAPTTAVQFAANIPSNGG